MEPLAYLHVVDANEFPLETDYAVSLSENLSQLSGRAAFSLLAATVALGIIGTAEQAMALVQQGNSGSEVTAIQQRLQALGYFQGTTTGYFGSVTKGAVVHFQQAQGLAPDGIVGPNTQAALDAAEEPEKGIWQLGDRGERVKAIQERLAVAGYLSDNNGVFDRAMLEAVLQFQQAEGLAVDGIVGPKTLAALPEVGSPESEASEPEPEPTYWYEDEEAPLDSFLDIPQ
jgi:peptidoglycan hydrolase-like protein with peptidoglycan-binding domain